MKNPQNLFLRVFLYYLKKKLLTYVRQKLHKLDIMGKASLIRGLLAFAG